WHANIAAYRSLQSSLAPSLHGPTRWTFGPTAIELLTRIPPFFIATALLLARRETRLMALAALPLFVWYFFFTPLHTHYFIAEFLWFTFALVSGFIAAVEWGARALGGATASAAAAVCIACFLGWAAWTGTPALANITFKYGPLPTPLEVDRAAAVQIVGPN